MKAGCFCLAMLVLSCSGLWAQQKPTLGPRPGPRERPSLHGARTWHTTDARKLVRVRTIFIQRIEHRLGEKLIDGLAKTGRFRVVDSPSEADAIVRGTCFPSRRLKLVHSEVYLTDRNSGAAIWQDSLRLPYNPPPLAEVVNETALAVVAHLGDSVREAERR